MKGARKQKTTSRRRRMHFESSRNSVFSSLSHNVFELPHFVEGKSHNESNQKRKWNERAHVQWALNAAGSEYNSRRPRGRIYFREKVFGSCRFSIRFMFIVHINFQSIWCFVSHLGIRCGASKWDGMRENEGKRLDSNL